MGYAISTGQLEPSLTLILLSLASLCFYHSGMALNDAVDAKTDEREHRGRPIELGLITRRHAYRTSYGLIAAGIGLCITVAFLAGVWTALWCGGFLAAAVYAYNTSAKATTAGPFLMGICRVLNVGLGQCHAAESQSLLSPEEQSYYGVGLMVYVFSVTYFAREEAFGGKRTNLLCATFLAVFGIFLLQAKFGVVARPESLTTQHWHLLWAIVALIATRGMWAAVLQPTPRNIGRGVGIAIQGLVVIDAVLAAIYAGPMAGLAILALLPVTMLLSRWIPQT